MRLWSYGIALAVSSLLAGGAIAQEKGDKPEGRGEKKGDDKGKHASNWAVIQIGDEVMAVLESKIPELEKGVAKDNKAAKKPKKGEKPAPKKTLKILKKGLTQDEAEKLRDKIEKDQHKGKDKDKEKDKDEKGDKKTGHK